FLGTAMWCSSAFYIQTRPTGNGATVLMCSLTNNIGGAASGLTVSYDFAKVLPVTEEVDGQRSFYSLTGVAGSWLPIANFSTAVPGRLSATLNINWPAGSPLYIIWGDDNGTGTPDTSFQIDNFSVIAQSAEQVAVGITSQPQSQTVAELSPVSFTVGTSGNPAPTFQWYKNGAPILDATNATYAIASAALSNNAAQFRVVAAN